MKVSKIYCHFSIWVTYRLTLKFLKFTSVSGPATLTRAGSCGFVAAPSSFEITWASCKNEFELNQILKLQKTFAPIIMMLIKD